MKDGGKVSKQVFSVTAKPDDGYLFLQFPGHPNIFTQARYFDEIEIMAKDAIFLILDIPKSEIEDRITYPARFSTNVSRVLSARIYQQGALIGALKHLSSCTIRGWKMNISLI